MRITVEQRLCCAVVAAVLLAQPAPRADAQAQDSVPVEVVIMLDNISPQDAISAALRRAHLEGVQKQCGVVGDSLNWGRRPEEVLDFLGIISHAQVKEVKVRTWEAIVEQRNMQAPPHLGYKVAMDVRVDCREKARAETPRNRLHCALNAMEYRPDDELILRVTASEPCYLQVLHFAPTDSVQLLLPNNLQPARLVRAGETVEIPAALGRRTGLARATVDVAPGQDVSRGLLWVVATPSALPLPNPTPLGGGLIFLGMTSEAIGRIAEWLLYMPASQRVMEVLQYEVRVP